MRYLLFIFLVFSGCRGDYKDPEPEILVPANVIPMMFKDGTLVNRAWVEDGYYYRKGNTNEKDCRLSRTKVIEKEGIMLMRMNGVTETCSGNNCSHCEFPKTGGCKCKNIGQGICNHTIVKNKEILMRL